MSLIMLLKIFSDCCVVFAIVGVAPVRFHFPVLLCGLVCGVGACMATFFEEKGRSFLRCLCAAVPLAGLLLAQGGTELVLMLIPVGYTVFTILRGKLELEYSGYTYFFVRTLWLLGGICAVCGAWNFLTIAAEDTVVRLNLAVLTRYGLVHALCGVVVQRQLRLGVAGQGAGGRGQVFTLVGTAGMIAGSFVLAEPMLRDGVVKLIRGFATVMAVGLLWIAEKLDRLLTKLKKPDGVKEWEDHHADQMAQQGGIANEELPPAEPAVTIDEMNINTLAMVLVGVFLVAAVVLLIFSFHKRRSQADDAEQIQPLKPAAKKKKISQRSNRGKVRQYYRDFLRLEKNLGMKIKNSDTSADVLSHIDAHTDKASAEALRQVYLSVRYDDRGNVTDRQVAQAKRALKGTQKSHKGVRI